MSSDLSVPKFLGSKRSRTPKAPHGKNHAIFKLWILRILVKLGCQRNFIDHSGDFNDTELAEYLGFPVQSAGDDDLHFSGEAKTRKEYRNKVLRELESLHVAAEESAKKGMALPDILEKNSLRLAKHLGFSDLDRNLLSFIVALNNESVLESAADFLGDLNNAKMFSCMATILDSDPKSIREAMSSSGKLCSTGILSIRHDFKTDLKSRIDIFSSEFSDRMTASEHDPIDLIRDRVHPGKAPTLTLEDYTHLDKDMTLLIHYLQESLKSKRAGVNIFVYGPPGTGKSELARLVANICKVPLFEIASEDNDGDPINGKQRLRAYRAAMSFFNNQPSVLLFDEVEDIYNDGSVFSASTATEHKAWLNRMLEESPVPTIWLSNSGRGIDPAFVRRYDMVFKLDIAPERRRKEILQDIAGEILSEADLKAAARSEHLAPAVVSRATNVIKAVKHNLPKEQWSSSLMHLMNNTLEMQDHDRVKAVATDLPSYYNPAFINANADLEEIANGLRSVPEARLCLYGPPGTGKTAYGRWLAASLGKPLLIKRASDLLSMWVGMTEKNIANAFREAENDGAILLIDEVENFLSDRRQAQHRWETSQVNEMLTQMEGFNGIFVASTNLMDGLDQAALRRFDIKLKFEYLRPEQAWELLRSQCATLGISAPTSMDKVRLNDLRMVTPGDFAVVARRHRLSKYKVAAEVVDQLRLEVGLKEDSKAGRAIGFVH